MSKPTLVADVRSVLRRCLPEMTSPEVIEFSSPRSLNNETVFPARPDTTIVDRARDVMNSLQTATVLSRLFPGTPLVLLAMPETSSSRDIEPPVREINTQDRLSGDLAAIIRTSLVEEFPESIPAAAEALLVELGVIERQDRSYYAADAHSEDVIAAYNYRQRRRSDILSELLALKRSILGSR